MMEGKHPSAGHHVGMPHFSSLTIDRGLHGAVDLQASKYAEVIGSQQNLTSH